METNLRAAAIRALEALESALSDDKPYITQSKEAITALRAALAEPEQELGQALARAIERINELEAELHEQARVNGMGGEREARLMAVNAELVEALRCADAMLSAANMDAKAVERKVTAALTKVEVSK